MPTIKEKYFELKKMNSTYLTENVIRSLLISVNNFKSNEELSLNMEKPMQNIDIFDNFVRRVLSGEPYQYVINSSSFCHLDFYVDSRVLIPRNETEELTLLVIDEMKKRHLESSRVLDVCTGSGCIAISINKEFPNTKVIGTDISSDALEVARINNEKLNTNVAFLNGYLVDPVLELNKFDVLVSNPPYILDESTVDKATLDYEPHLALFANPNTKYYEKIISSIPYIMKDHSFIAFEIENGMEKTLPHIIEKYLPHASYTFKKDIYGLYRFLFIDYVEVKDDLVKARDVLLKGGIVAFPTETVMGLGVIYNDVNAYNRLNVVKNRPNDKPYTLMLDSYQKIERFAYLNELAIKIIKKCQDESFTLLLKRKNTVPDYVTHGTDIIGVRVPDDYRIKKLISIVELPLLVPSANKSGEKPALNSNEAREIFKDEVDYYLEGESGRNKPSTIIDLTNNEIKIIREGELTLERLKRLLEEVDL